MLKSLTASLVAIQAAAELRVCNYEEDMEVEFSECDPYGSSRNGKSPSTSGSLYHIVL